MKLIKGLLLMGVLTLGLHACKKDEQRAVLIPGAAPTLSASSTTLVLDSAGAASKTAITFNWGAMSFGAQIAPTYTLQIDSIKDNFLKPVEINLGTGLSKTYTVADFNALATSLGVAPTVAGKIHARVKVDVDQSNGLATSVPTTYSNVLDITVTPYSTKPKPVYPVPDNLYIVGDATGSGWNNPVDTPSQKFTRIDDYTYGIVTNLIGGKSYLLLPLNGDWSHKFGGSGKTGGALLADNAVPGSNTPAPDASGTYTIIVDYVKGTYTVTAGNTFNVPTSLFIVGDATAGQWNNPVPVPSQQFKQTSSGEFSITVSLTGGKSYLLLPVNGSWDHKFGGTSKTGGALLSDNAVPGSNTPAPDASGTYKMYVNFFSKQYTVTQ